MFTRPSSTSLSIFNFQIVHHQPPFPNAKPHPDLRVFHHHKAVQKCSLNHLLLSRSSIFILLSFSERTPVAFSLLNFKASFRTVALGIVTLYFTFFEKESAYYWVDSKLYLCTHLRRLTISSLLLFLPTLSPLSTSTLALALPSFFTFRSSLIYFHSTIVFFFSHYYCFHFFILDEFSFSLARILTHRCRKAKMPAHSSLRHPKKTLMKASSFDVLRQLSFEQENAFDCGRSDVLVSFFLVTKNA